MNLLLVLAAIKLVSPVDDTVVPLIPECQRTVITNVTRAARQAVFAAKLPKGDDWRKAKDLELVWRATEGEAGSWEVSLGKKPDLSDAVVAWAEAWVFKPDTNQVVRFVFPRANLEIATRYYWRVRNLSEKKPTVSAAGTFVTEDMSPRWIALEGRTGNFRDLGGRIGMNGRRVRQGLVFRSQGLNDNSLDGKREGRNRLMVEDVAYLTKTLGIRTDLDLRRADEAAHATVSPIGPSVAYVHRSSFAYGKIFTDEGKKAMAENFRLFCDEKNYPILFHCFGGADRTGALAYVLLCVLGVSRQEIETDWEATFYPDIPYKDLEGKHRWNSEGFYDEGFAKYGEPGDTWNRRIELYLLDCGVTAEEIARFRDFMIK